MTTRPAILDRRTFLKTCGTVAGGWTAVPLLAQDVSTREADTLHPRPLPEIRETLAELTVRKPENGLDAERQAALARLKVFRFLAGVPYSDLTLDDEYNRHAQAASRLLAKIGRLDHTPTNPGLPDDEYRLAYKGTSSSNLGSGYSSLARAVDGWMDDSDTANISRLGHRRWCLNPLMGRTGFGRTGKFTVMYVFDQSRQDAPDYDYIAYPVRGFMPVDLFAPHAAWNVSLHPRKYRPSDGVRIAVTPADHQGKKLGEPLKLNHSTVNRDGFGVPFCLIFRPEKVAVASGRRYLVEIDGLSRFDGTSAPQIRYLVDFARIPV